MACYRVAAVQRAPTDRSGVLSVLVQGDGAPRFFTMPLPIDVMGEPLMRGSIVQVGAV